jgi:hypothetical protein
MLKSGSFFNHLAVKVLFCVVGLFGLAGCSQTPKIYKMLPERIEKIRSDLGTIGVTVSYYPVKRETNMPAKGFIGGAERGFAMGAAYAVMIGFVSPVPGGTLLGLLAAPFTATAGIVYGAIKAVPPEDVEKAKAALHQAVARLREMNFRQSFREEVVKLGMEQTGLRFVPLSGMGPQDPNEVIQYDQMDIRGIDTILELRFEAAGLSGHYRIDPLLVAFIEVSAQLIQAHDNKVLISESSYCASEEQRKYTEWAKDEGQLFVDEFISCLQELPEKIVDDFFLVYPVSSH